MASFLKKYAQIVFDNGYEPVFIRPGEKRPFGAKWEQKTHGPKTIAKAIEAGRGNFGVGIKTKLTPLVDIDCYDEALVEHMRQFAEELIGPTLERTGQAPKLGMLYRADKPFPKTQSAFFIDDEGRPVKLEVLGEGQQFVAFHIHPDTGKPYKWKDGITPATVAAEDVQIITHEDASELVAEFERQCRNRGWPEKSTVKRLESRSGDFDYDDPFITDKHKIEITAEELRAKLQMVPNPEDHETWFMVGMALYHQFDGSDDGLEMWHEWSAEADNYKQDDLDYRWTTFDVEGKKREPLTARFILKLAKAEEDRIATDEFDEIKEAIADCSSVQEVKKVCERVKRTAFDSLLRATIVGEVVTKLKQLGTSMTKSAVGALTRYENPENHATPPWLESFVYVQMDETFYSPKTRQSLSKNGFDASYNRYMMTKKDRLEGRSSPEHTASHVALNRYLIPTVANRMYLPGEDEIFEIAGLKYVNSYSDISVPEVPERIGKKGRQAIERVLAHFEHLFKNDRDRKLLLSWLAHIVQTNKRVNWAPVIQGAEGDGKTFFYMLLGAVLGADNVKTIQGDALAEIYSSWAEGSQFVFVEEVRLHGKDRFSVINKVKPYITNAMAPIRRMKVDTYNVINTVNYMLTTNFKDGVPVSGGDSRYFPMFSRWQTKGAIAAFNKANPRYYDELHEALFEAGSLRRWLLDYELCAEFNPMKRAPISADREEMVYLNQSEEEEALLSALDASDNPLFCEALLDSGMMTDALLGQGATAPQTSAVKRLLVEAGFAPVIAGKVTQVKVKGKARRLWSQDRDRWIKDGVIDTAAIRRFVAEGGDPI